MERSEIFTGEHRHRVGLSKQKPAKKRVSVQGSCGVVIKIHTQHAVSY